MPPTATYYTLRDVHGAGAQRSDPKSGSYTSFYLGLNQAGDSVYGQGPQGDVIRINNYVRLVRDDSSAMGINEIINDHLLNIYPNPVSNSCTISFNCSISQATVGVYNLLGSKVKEINASNSSSIEIDLSDVPNGIYILSATTDKGITFNKKLIVAR
jgi:hypothetical protein